MDEKLYIQDIVDSLAEKQNIQKTEAEAFVKTAFEIIKDALVTDKIVKIKGLGTFKLTEVNSRESVNVNTGERIRIESHTKISFVPDMQMRDLINKPFSHFETVVLNEGVDFEDMSVAVGGDEVKENSEEHPEFPREEQEEVPSEIPSISIEPKENTKPLPNPIIAKDKEKVKSNHHSALFYGLSIAFVTILVVCGVIFFVYYKEFLNNDAIDTVAIEQISTIQKETESSENNASSPTDTVLAIPKIQSEDIDTTKTIITGVRKGYNTVIADSTSYEIIGTMSVYKIGAGETLTMVSKRFYETKDLWPYIVMHNREVIKKPNRVLSGTVVRIPALRDKKK